jgi:glycosyltransferase involved in cell wall biosynthesis
MISLNYPHPNNPSFGAWFKNQIGAYADYVDIDLFVPVHITPSISKFRQQHGIGRKLRITGQKLREYVFSRFPAFSSPVNGRYIRFFSIPPKQLFPFSGGVILALRMAFSLLGNRNFNVIHGQSILPEGMASILLGKMFRRPSLVTAIGSDIHAVRNGSITYKTTLFVLRHATLITTVSCELKDRIVKMGIPGDKVIVVPNGVDPNLATRYKKLDIRDMLDIPVESKVFGFVGRLIPVKDPMTLIRAFGRLCQRWKDTYLVFVGNGGLRKDLAAEAERLGVKDRVRFTEGAVPPEQIPSYMEAIDYLCVSSTAEGWPNVILEAMICGKPVIATEVGGIPEAVSSDRYGFLVPARDPDAMSNAMDQAIRTNWDRESIVEYAKSHSWSQVGAQYFNLYRRLCLC